MNVIARQKDFKYDYMAKQSVVSLDNVKATANQVGDSGNNFVCEEDESDSFVGMLPWTLVLYKGVKTNLLLFMWLIKILLLQ